MMRLLVTNGRKCPQSLTASLSLKTKQRTLCGRAAETNGYLGLELLRIGVGLDCGQALRPGTVLQPSGSVLKQKKKACAMDKVKWSLGFRQGVVVDCSGRSRGLALWWRDSVQVLVRPWCQYYIDAATSYEGKSC